MQVSVKEHGIYVDIGQLLPAEEVELSYRNNDLLDENFRNSLTKNTFYSITFNSVKLNNCVLRFLLESDPIFNTTTWIDTDYGKIISGKQVLTKLKENSELNWGDL